AQVGCVGPDDRQPRPINTTSHREKLMRVVAGYHSARAGPQVSEARAGTTAHLEYLPPLAVPRAKGVSRVHHGDRVVGNTMSRRLGDRRVGHLSGCADERERSGAEEPSD